MLLSENYMERMMSPGDYKIVAHVYWQTKHTNNRTDDHVLFDEKSSLEEMQKLCKTLMYNQGIAGAYFIRIFVYDHGEFTAYAYQGFVEHGTRPDEYELKEANG